MLVATKPDGAFSWEVPCKMSERLQIRVSLGQGYCVIDTNGYVSSDTNSDQALFVDRGALEVASTGPCPSDNDERR